MDRLPELRLTVEHLRSFIAVAEELSFRRAAERLYVASSPLSRRIRDVETAVGATLFERDTRHVRLTAAGETLLPLARDVVRRFTALTWTVRDGTLAGGVAIGLASGVHPADRARVIAAARSVGDTRLLVETGDTPDLCRRVNAGELHTAVVITSADTLRDLETLVLRREDYGVAVPAGDPVAALDAVPLERLAHLRLATLARRERNDQALELQRLAEKSGADATPVLVQDVTRLASVVATQACFAFTPLDSGGSYRRALEDPDVAIRPLSDHTVQRLTLATWLAERADSDVILSALVAELRAAFTR